MTRVLLIGLKPEAVDYDDPDLPPGMTSDRIAAGIEATLADMRARGWEAEFCAILPDETAETTISEALTNPADAVVIGGGVRIPSRNLLLFERVINAVILAAPGTPIAFNERPDDSANAAARWLR